MDCPNCGAEHTVVEKVSYGEQVVRERWCPLCLVRFETVEVVRSVVRMQAFQAALWRSVSGSGG